MDKTMRLTFSSSIADITEVNDSFDRGFMRICYAGANRNKTVIPKSVIEEAIPTMFNCPVVCHYDVMDDTIGGHDIDVVKTDNGLKLVNLTDAVGVVPDGAAYKWETVDDNGVLHDYFCVEVILWKRSAAYEHIKENGVTSQSMEISVRDGFSDGGYFNIKKFTFTAFCLLGDDVEPCFEGASLELFSLSSLQDKFTAMMKDVKQLFYDVNPSLGDNEDGLFAKGGMDVDTKVAILTEFGLTIDDIDFSILDISEEELRNKLTDLKKFDGDGEEEPGDGGDGTETEGTGTEETGNETTGGDTTGGNDSGSGGTTDPPSDDPSGETTGGTTEGGTDGKDDSGSGTGSGSGGSDDSGSGTGSGSGGSDDSGSGTETPTPDDDDDDNMSKLKKNRFSLLAEQTACELNCLGGAEMFTDPLFGDLSRYGYVDFDPEAHKAYFLDFLDFNYYGFDFSFNGDNVEIDWNTKKRAKITFVDFDDGNTASNYSSMLSPIIDRVSAEKVEELFSQFGDLDGKEEYEALKENHSGMTVSDVESKCFEIRGRYAMNFSANTKHSTRLPGGLETKESNSEPYNGLFLKYLNN